MPEFHSDEQRETYVNALLREQEEAEQHWASAVEAGADTKAHDEHLASIKAELSRLGVEVEDDKKPAAEKRPAKPAAETR